MRGVLESTVDRSNNRLTLQSRAFSGEESKVHNAQTAACLRIILHFRALKSGQPKPLGNNACVDHLEMNMKSVTS